MLNSDFAAHGLAVALSPTFIADFLSPVTSVPAKRPFNFVSSGDKVAQRRKSVPMYYENKCGHTFFRNSRTDAMVLGEGSR